VIPESACFNKEKNVIKKVASCFSTTLFFILISTQIYASVKLIAEKSQFDFGTVREGVNAAVKFKISNTGAEAAQISEIRTFAACVESRPLPKKELAPGESMELEYVFETLGYGGVSVDKQIEIFYNNAKLNPLKLCVKGKVLPLESYQASLGELTYNFFVLIDVRPRDHFLKEHIIGAINVPYQKLARWATDVSGSLSEEIIIYLYSEDGKKSDEAAKMLRKKGFSRYISLVGGLKEWKQQKGRKLLVAGSS